MNTIKQLMANWKTTSAGLTMIFGSVIHLIFSTKAHTGDETTWTLSAGTIIGGLGLIFAGDSSTTDKQIAPIAAAVDKINQTGPSHDTATLSKPPESKT
jgi:hypothetical protein